LGAAALPAFAALSRSALLGWSPKRRAWSDTTRSKKLTRARSASELARLSTSRAASAAARSAVECSELAFKLA
jgi:hypothetical protein